MTIWEHLLQANLPQGPFAEKADDHPIKRIGSRPLKESTKQITSPTKSGHAPPSNESRKNY
jgi:hypothetical protein